MRISRLPNRQGSAPSRRHALDVWGLAFALAFLPELAAARAGVALEPHPGWIAALVLAARYGSVGLIAGLAAAAVAMGIGSAVAGAGFLPPWSSLDTGPNLIAFGVCLVVSWIASWHLRCQTDLHERERGLSDRCAAAEATVETLRDVVATLRSRVDRTAASVSFLRDVVARLEGTDPVAAAEGAADLALARTGACAAAVQVGEGGFQRLLAVRDARGPASNVPLALRDADLIVPIRDENRRIGAIALWGIPRVGLDRATAYDLAVVASWCEPAITVAARCPDEAAGRERRVV